MTVNFMPTDPALKKDLRQSAEMIGPEQARFLVDTYYAKQDERIRQQGRIRAMEESEEPHAHIQAVFDFAEAQEHEIRYWLDKYSAAHPVGKWMRYHKGVGPVIAAGFLAHLDITRALYAGQFWSFAGLNPEAAWIGGAKAKKAILAFVDPKYTISPVQIVDIAKGLECCPKWLARRAYRLVTESPDVPVQGFAREMDDLEYIEPLIAGLDIKVKHVVEALSKRPWNTALKTLCWKLGESFIKVSNRDGAIYGELFRQRKEAEVEWNRSGKNAETATATLEKKNIGRTTMAYKAYEQGKLPDAQVNARARRWVVKVFLSHLHEVWWEHEYGKKPPEPYAISILGHGDHIKPFPASVAAVDEVIAREKRGQAA